MRKKNIITSLIIGTTFVLAGVGIFTSLRLYQLRGQAVAPNAPQSKLFAWDCTTYSFGVSQTGDVSIENASDRTEPAQKADVLIDGAKVGTFDVPGFGPRSPKTIIGHVDVPISGNFDWKVVGSLDCQQSGSYNNQPACAGLQTGPDSGNWNSTPSFTTRNTTSSPITVHWLLDCENRQENIGRPAMSSCHNTSGDVTLQPNETLTKGLGAVCLTWQLDFTCNGRDIGYVVEPQNCATPTGSPTTSPSTTPTGSPTSSPTGTPTTTPLPNMCSLNFTLGATSTPTATPTTTPTSTPQVACNKQCSTDATCKAIDSSYTCYPPTSTCRLSAFPDRQECNIPQTTSPTPHNSFECNSVCSSNAECLTIGSQYTCFITGVDKRCRIATNTGSATCQTGGTGTPRATATGNVGGTNTNTSPTPVTLPSAGVGLPTIGLILGGALLTIIAIVVAL